MVIGEDCRMKSIFILILTVLLIFTSPLVSSSEERDMSKYTPMYNEALLEEIGSKVYDFLKDIDQTDTYKNRRDVLLDVFEIVDEYRCNKKLYIVNRGIDIKSVNKIIKVLTLSLPPVPPV